MEYDMIIIGGGISGLSVAHYCVKEGMKTLVLEKAPSTGGAFCSQRVPGGADDFWFELGDHTCYNSYGRLLQLMEDCQLMDRIIPRAKAPYKMVVKDELSSIASQIGFGELLWSVPRLLFAKKHGESVKSYYSKVLGKRNFRRVFSSVFSAVPSQNADAFPADILFKKRTRRKDVAKSFTLQRGLQSLTEAISAQPGIELLVDRKVARVQMAGDRFHITDTDDNCFTGRALALATPVSVTADLLQSAFPEIARLLAGIKVETVESLGVAVDKNGLSLASVAGIIPLADHFYSVVSRDLVAHADYRAFTFHFKPGVLSREAKLKRMGQILGLKPDCSNYVMGKENLVPALRVGHEGIVQGVDELLRGKALFLTGNYFAGLSIEDCVGRSFDEFCRLKGQLANA